LAPERTALLIVDVQNDFGAPDGLNGRAGFDLSAVDPAVDRIAALIDGARAAGVPPVFIRLETGPAVDSPAAAERRARLGAAGGRPCAAGTRGADYYRIRPAPGEVEIVKNRYSSFVNTPLDFVLNARPGCDTLVVCGLTTECCVETTVRDAFARDYQVFVPHDATAAYAQDLHEVSLKVLGMYFALIVSTEQLLSAWRAPRS
jgi:ureidoacrylate peracid hydrolase